MFEQIKDVGQGLGIGNLVGIADRQTFKVCRNVALTNAVGDQVARRFQLAMCVVIVKAAPSGSARPILTFSLRARSVSATPASVPPEPTAQMKSSMRPLVCCQISGPMDLTWAWRLSTLSNWLAQMAPSGNSALSFSARRCKTFI